MSMVLLILGTVLALVFLVFFIRGQKYNYMFEPLSGDDFPFPALYVAGMAIQEMKWGQIPAVIGFPLRENTRLIYSAQYSEYYARVIWSQALSMGLFFPAVCFLIGSMIPDMAMIMGFLGSVMMVLPGYYFINHVHEQAVNRKKECEMAFPNAISKLTLIVNSGVILHEAWNIVAKSNKGTFYELMQQSCEEMRNGTSDAEAIINFGNATNSEEIRKFTSMMVQSIRRGGGELPAFLRNQSKEMWQSHRQRMLQKGETAAAELLIPIVLMFVGVILIILFAAMANF